MSPLLLLFMSTAFAGQLVVDARVPAELSIGGLPVARLYHPSVLRLEVEEGPTALTVVTTGDPETLPIEVTDSGEQWILIGRAGVSTQQRGAPEPVDQGEDELGEVEFRVIGKERVTVRIGKERHRLGPDETLDLSLPVGEHRLQIRSGDGTVIWASGVLDVLGGPLVVQIGEGRMPETARSGGGWRPDPR